MKPPRFLLLAALLFWGWQSQMLLAGGLAGAVLEAAAFSRWRWELEEVDFSRIWSFCVLLVLAMAAYVFTNNEAGGGLSGLQHGAILHNAAISSTQTATTVMRWLPLIFFPFLVAQAFNLRTSIPLASVSLLVRRRQRREGLASKVPYLDVSYPYFMVCIFSAGVHTNQGSYSYFWGQGILVLWALWTLRSRRYGVQAWAFVLVAVLALGFLGQFGITRVERLAQNLNAQWLARFLRNKTDPLQSATSLGQIGELKLSPRIVIRLQPRAPGRVPEYLREASYRNYRTQKQTWLAVGSRNDFNSVQPEPDATSWLLVAGKTNTAVVNVVCYLNGRTQDGDPEGLLPLPSGSCRLENFPAERSVIALQTNRNGAVLVTGAGQLMLFDARFGPGATLDVPPDASTNQFDLRVPAEESNALAKVIAEMNLAGTSTGEIRSAIMDFFASHFSYSTWQGLDPAATNGTPLTRFLLAHRRGHCEYFATATVLLLRQLGIPARYAVGYYVHEPAGSGYVVRERDAHAWCLLWNGHNWEDFDTTPGSEPAVNGPFAAFTQWLGDVRSWLGFQFAKFRSQQTHLRPYLLWTFVPLMTVLLYFIFFQRRKKSRPTGKRLVADTRGVIPGQDSAFYRLEQGLAPRMPPRLPGEPLSLWLEKAFAEAALADQRGTLLGVLQLHYRYRFDPCGLTDDEKALMEKQVTDLLASLAIVSAHAE